MFFVWTLQKPNFMMDAEENLHVCVRIIILHVGELRCGILLVG